MDFGVNSKGWTAIDGADGPSLCAVSVKTSGRAGDRPQVLAAAEVQRGAAGTEPANLQALLAAVDRRLPMLLTLPRDQYRLRVVPEPAVPQREMLSSLRWTLSAESDVSLDDFNLAWMRIPTDELLPTRPRHLYVIMSPKAELTARLAAWRQAGARPKVVDIRETALRNIAGALERPGEGLALLCADADGVGMVFTHAGSLYLDRFIEQPVAELRSADAATRTRLHERIAVQLLRSIDVIGRSYPFMPISRVVLAPAAESLGLAEFLGAQLPLPVETLDLNKVFDLSKVPTLAQSAALQARCLVPLGAALRSAKVAAGASA